MVSKEMVEAALAAIVTDYRADDGDDDQLTVERAMMKHGFHHPIDPGELVTAIIEAALAVQQGGAAPVADGGKRALAATGKQQAGEAQEDALAQFEAWAKSAGLETKIYAHNDMHSHPVTRGAWMAWQHLAARPRLRQEPVSIKSVRQFIADRTPNEEYREDILSGDHDHSAWFDHIRELMTALSQGNNS